MRKKLVLLTCLFCLMFSSFAFADEITDEKVISTMDLDSINLSLTKSGLNTISLDPTETEVDLASFKWNNSSSGYSEDLILDPHETAYGLAVKVLVSDSDISQHNIITFDLSNSYFDGYSGYTISSGSADDITLEDNILTIYNPHRSLTIFIRALTPYTNNTGSGIRLYVDGITQVLSSGVELLEIFLQYFTVNQVVVILSAAVGSCITLVFMWWGVRKMANGIMSAFRKGKLRI